MTIEADDILHQYTVAGIGPYPVSWPYLTDGLVVSVDIAGIVTALDPADFTADPTAGASGNVFLTAPAAATHAGRQLFITRNTPAEQGWQGVLGERERGLEAQLDRIVMLIQELGQLAASSLRIQGATPQPAYVTDRGVLMWDGSTLIIGPDATEIADAQGFATAAHADMLAAAAFAAAAATFDPALYLAKAGNLSGLTDVPTALQSGLGFSSYMAGLRATASKAALQTALDLSLLAYKSSVVFTDINGAAVRLSSEGFATATDTELATTAWAKGYADGVAVGIGQSWQTVSRNFGTSYQNTTGKPIQINVYTTNQQTFAASMDVSADGTTWLPLHIRPSTSYLSGSGLAQNVTIPPNWYYRVVITSGTAPTYSWVELR